MKKFLLILATLILGVVNLTALDWSYSTIVDSWEFEREVGTTSSMTWTFYNNIQEDIVIGFNPKLKIFGEQSWFTEWDIHIVPLDEHIIDTVDGWNRFELLYQDSVKIDIRVDINVPSSELVLVYVYVDNIHTSIQYGYYTAVESKTDVIDFITPINNKYKYYDLYGREIPDILEYSGMFIRINNNKVEKLYK